MDGEGFHQLLGQPRQLGQVEEDRRPQVPSLLNLSLHSRHLLSNCKEALDRFEWRHNNILHYLQSLFTSQQQEGVEIYADLEGHRVNGVTIPADVAMTAQKPDLVIINRKAKEVKLIELTVPWDTSANIQAATTRKAERYKELPTPKIFHELS